MQICHKYKKNINLEAVKYSTLSFFIIQLLDISFFHFSDSSARQKKLGFFLSDLKASVMTKICGAPLKGFLMLDFVM